MPITMGTIHQEETQDTLDAVTDLRRNLLEVVELRLWDIFLSRRSSIMSYGIVTYGTDLYVVLVVPPSD